jgi:hypothetical protein
MNYAALILQKAITGDSAHPPLYEETVILVNASSLDEAWKKAESFASDRQPVYRNAAGEVVTWSLERVVDVVPAADPSKDGAEIYSRHFRNYDDYVRFEVLMQKPAKRD